MPKLSDDLFLEKWARASRRFGDGDFRTRVYDILEKFGITSQRAWEMTNLIRQYAAAFSHFFDVTDTVEIDETGNRVYPIWNFIAAMTYKLLLEEFETQQTLPKQRSRLIERAITQMRPEHQSVIIPYTSAEDLRDVVKRFEADFPENFPIDTFFTAKAAQIRQAIESEDKEVAAYSDAVDDLKHQVLKVLAPAPLETKENLS